MEEPEHRDPYCNHFRTISTSPPGHRDRLRAGFLLALPITEGPERLEVDPLDHGLGRK